MRQKFDWWKLNQGQFGIINLEGCSLVLGINHDLFLKIFVGKKKSHS